MSFTFFGDDVKLLCEAFVLERFATRFLDDLL